MSALATNQKPACRLVKIMGSEQVHACRGEKEGRCVRFDGRYLSGLTEHSWLPVQAIGMTL